MMLTVKQLLRQTAQGAFGPNRRTKGSRIIQNANNVSIAFNKAKYGKDPRGYYRSITCAARTNESGKRTKKLEFRFYYPKPMAKKDQFIPEPLRDKGTPYIGPKKEPQMTLESKVWVSCSCEWFLFVCEVADAESDNATVRYSNGMFPKITNPQGIGTVCKHIISALRKGALLKK